MRYFVVFLLALSLSLSSFCCCFLARCVHSLHGNIFTGKTNKMKKKKKTERRSKRRNSYPLKTKAAKTMTTTTTIPNDLGSLIANACIEPVSLIPFICVRTFIIILFFFPLTRSLFARYFLCMIIGYFFKDFIQRVAFFSLLAHTG